VRINVWQNNETGEIESGISMNYAKNLLRTKGGVAFTEFYDRDGSFCETRPISLSANNTTKVRLSSAPSWIDRIDRTDPSRPATGGDTPRERNS
jgi:hypothetical protein